MEIEKKQTVDTTYCILKQVSVPGCTAGRVWQVYTERYHLEVLTSFSLALWSFFSGEYKAGYSFPNSFLKCEVNV